MFPIPQRFRIKLWRQKIFVSVYETGDDNLSNKRYMLDVTNIPSGSKDQYLFQYRLCSALPSALDVGQTFGRSSDTSNRTSHFYTIIKVPDSS